MNHKPTYEELLQEIDRISQENISLRKVIVEMGGVVKNATSKVGLLRNEATVNSSSKLLIHLSVEEKVALFQSIFRGRKDVFAYVNVAEGWNIPCLQKCTSRSMSSE